MNKLKKIKDFNSAADHYDSDAIMQSMIAEELIDRLHYIKINPKRILDIGSATGRNAILLAKIFPAAEIYELDFSIDMLRVSMNKSSGFRKLFSSKKRYFINADMDLLPFHDNTFDLIVSSNSIQWSENINALFKNINNLLTIDGLFLFSSFLKNTLIELQHFKEHALTQNFLTIQEYAEILNNNNFYDPVLIRDEYQNEYDGALSALRDLKKIGVTKSDESHKSLRGKNYLLKLIDHLDQFKRNDKNILSYEVIMAHAWKIRNKEESVIRFTKS
ncbi:MAG: methyltransferase domain-containing protein [Betaproteobacteria bacterium]|jgi:malonyl-CoA O-methyltransferase|nr:methyltransferase domain-containing protein [Betaproteobacteria bacterium]